MKKLYFMIIALLTFGLLLVACSQPTEEAEAPAEEAEAEAPAEEVEAEAPAEEEVMEAEEGSGYQFGLNETFYSEEPVSYSMYFSDASWYPMVDTWITEGLWEDIRERTNVTLDTTSYDSSDYTNKITLEINAGDAAYIIPKVYDETPFVTGGAVVPVSDYVQYMPNYMDFVETYNMEPDISTIIRDDGKYYRLPGMHEAPYQDYTLAIRNDIFTAAGYDVAALEADWTWEDLHEILVGVKAYLVEEGMISESDYIWSDLWSGSESGQNSGGYLLNLVGKSYGVKAGWGRGNCMVFDADTDSWSCGSTSDNYKEFVTIMNKFVADGILDPETFTQDEDTAMNKFYNGESVIIGYSKAQQVPYVEGLNLGVGEGNWDLYVTVAPKGTNNYIAEASRLENGVMVSQNALEDLGEEDFIKMIRFIDWLWYSDEAYTLFKWGVEGEHWEYVTDPETGLEVKQLLPGFKNGGLGIAGEEEDLDIRLQWGYAGGNFWYGHRNELRDDSLSPLLQEYSQRVLEYRDLRPLEPAVITTEDENEMLTLWQTGIIDTINTWTLNFITGSKDIDADWDAYIAELDGANLGTYTDMYNEAYQRSK
jgi:putative aldouronate transport system substrate-binding protein